MPSPVVLFVYNRKKSTQQTAESLAKNLLASETDLLVFSDGPRANKDKSAVSEVREYIRTITGFKSVRIFESDVNKGLATSIIDGVTLVLREHETVIVLEDDMVTSPYFLSYMNNGLVMYEADVRVISIHGYVYPVKQTLPDSFFIRGADCWGWATWERGWKSFESNGNKLLKELESRGMTTLFDYNGAYPFTQMLRDQIGGLNDSWAIRWQASAFLKDRLTLYPGKSYILNVGFDSSGTHSGVTDVFDGSLQMNELNLQHIPIEENAIARTYFETYFRSIRPTLFDRIMRKLNSVIVGFATK